MAASRYDRGFADGRREAARLLLDTQADNAVTLAGRLSEFPEAVAAVNEVTAILRDAAKALRFVAPKPKPKRGEPSPQGTPDGNTAEVDVERPATGDPSYFPQEAPDAK